MTTEQPPVEHLDVIVVGAGISGIGAGRYLATELPGKTSAILEARATSGGTWDLFRYPGIRSDSDLHTFGYAFKPWRDEQSIADAPRILAYLRETITENGLDDRIRYSHRVLSAAWSTAEARWLVDVERTDTGERLQLSAGWLFCAGGYYRYDEGFTPAFPGRDRFRGPVVHPQHWPEDLEYAGRRVLVIGSGATAVTLVPAMAGTAGSVTMLQRTPSYVVPVPRSDALAARLCALFGEERGYALARRKNIAVGTATWRFCRRYPRAARRLIRWVTARQLPAGYPVDEHFNPPYDPWDQRLCAVPDGDLFRAIREGRAEVVTDRVATFTEDGVLLESGRELAADVVVTATGLDVQAIGGIALTVDGEPVHLPDTVVYKGMMLSGVPNLVLAIGYTNSSWTLKTGLVCEHFCRLLAHLDAHGYDVARPEPADPDMPTRPLLDLAAGYVRRAADRLPRQGDRAPWLTSTSYPADVRLLRAGSVTDPELHLSRAASPAAVPAGAAR
ncbi:Predicted flavoprotein CzcO associated with the cation diffusion facilitator CzcD [Geodermatophilus pulveris]|uniref:Predicted flavoprotein CzcO associated with the cation diffusion facilitator CzcD n=1 Tax=Geodermatophilus pulveris TaxID=1564159 RepID=A0A239C8I1_9ACTN|nr:NAD(P)/FAD-dependent oxidoreductase [Geodermatophilus pulveris]SNS16249.1 Predicted flavoprotein CzcO associated with the cation diffusion facilitator CzcD [Geodermatophilus pulveris]